MKKLIALMLVLMVVVSVSACGREPTQNPISTDGEQQQDDPQEQDTAETTPVTIDTAVLFEQDGLVVTAKELVDDSRRGIGIKVTLENNSEKNVGVQCNSLIVNNYMFTDSFSCSVAAGKKANDTIYLSSSDLEAAEIATISDVVVSFHVYDSDSYDILFDTEEIEIRTSAYKPAIDDGEELYNQNNIRIVVKYLVEDSFWGAGILLFVENNCGEDVLIQCDNMSVNGFMVTPAFSCTISNGRMALDEISIRSSDLEENDIEAVEEIELVFRIINPDTYATITETEPITFSMK